MRRHVTGRACRDDEAKMFSESGDRTDVKLCESPVNQHIRVLIVEVEAQIAQRLASGLLGYGYFCEVAPSINAALSALGRAACDLVLCGVSDDTGAEVHLLERLTRHAPAVPVIMLAAGGSTTDAVAAIKRGAFQYLVAPFAMDDLHTHIHRALAQLGSRVLRTPPRTAGEPDQARLVHESAGMRALVELMPRLALSAAPLLIHGDTGTGKEVVARSIHALGPRRDRPFVAINTTAIPEQLLESELFGHVKGAYTGASQARPGLFVEADGGSLLLDEIGDMPRMLQPKLLRALQFGEIRPVGADSPRSVDVRLMAATHRDLRTLVAEGVFRDDLRYRLNTVTLHIPPLRERREDIPMLVQKFLLQARVRCPSSPVTAIAPDAMKLLEQAAWPGNVRELESAIERCVVLGRERMVMPADLGFLSAQAAAPAGSTWPQANGRPFTLRQMNHCYLEWVLQETQGDKARAAALLDIDLSTLYRWQRAKA